MEGIGPVLRELRVFVAVAVAMWQWQCGSGSGNVIVAVAVAVWRFGNSIVAVAKSPRDSSGNVSMCQCDNSGNV
jgi:hypothetical protein